jgi:hypothetical protein
MLVGTKIFRKKKRCRNKLKIWSIYIFCMPYVLEIIQ